MHGASYNPVLWILNPESSQYPGMGVTAAMTSLTGIASLGAKTLLTKAMGPSAALMMSAGARSKRPRSFLSISGRRRRHQYGIASSDERTSRTVGATYGNGAGVSYYYSNVKGREADCVGNTSPEYVPGPQVLRRP